MTNEFTPVADFDELLGQNLGTYKRELAAMNTEVRVRLDKSNTMHLEIDGWLSIDDIKTLRKILKQVKKVLRDGN